MPRMVSRRRYYVKTALRRLLKKTNDKRLSIRIRIAIMAVDDHKPSQIASVAGCSVSTVHRVITRFEEQSIEGLFDRRIVLVLSGAVLVIVLSVRSRWHSITSTSTFASD